MALSSRHTIALRNVVLGLFLVLQVLLAPTLAARPGPRHGRALLAHGTVLTEYIGASGDPNIQLTDIPLTAGVTYIFPLSFAIDADAAGNVANGVFSPYWSTSITPASAQSFAQANSNVRLALSLGGATQYVSDSNPSRSVDWYDPSDTDAWIANAVTSISTLATQYSLTGIDIDYENFPQGSAKFTTCIGGLISQLKSAGTITEASIAPFGQTRAIYADLFQSFGSAIDYVNYQFYAEGLTSQSEYVNKFNDVAGTFVADKLLASVNVEGGANAGLQGNDFIGAVQQLPSVAGIMIWDADHDKASGFSMANSAATFLTS